MLPEVTFSYPYIHHHLRAFARKLHDGLGKTFQHANERDCKACFVGRDMGPVTSMCVEPFTDRNARRQPLSLICPRYISSGVGGCSLKVTV